MRGAAHIGVLMAMEERGVRPSSIAGTSAGAIVAGLYAAGVSVGDLQKLAADIAGRRAGIIDVNFAGILRMVAEVLGYREVTLPGLLSGDKLEKLLRRYVADRSMQTARIPLAVPAVDLLSGDTVAFTSADILPQNRPGLSWTHIGEMADVMRASSACPGVFAPKQIGEYRLIDGGVTDNLPAELLRALGETKIVGVDLERPPTAKRGDNLFEVSVRALSIMESALRECEAERVPYAAIRPELPDDAGLLTLHAIPECIECGYRAGCAFDWCGVK